MTTTIELSSGKIIDLDRFVALVPSEKATDETYSLILEGSVNAIALNSQEAKSIKQRLQPLGHKENNGTWDPEEQLRKNQPKLKKLREWIDKKKQEAPSSEKEAAFEEFKQIIDAERPVGQKLYEH